MVLSEQRVLTDIRRLVDRLRSIGWLLWVGLIDGDIDRDQSLERCPKGGASCNTIDRALMARLPLVRSSPA